MRRITAILLWLVAAGATAVVAWSAVSLAGDQVADRPVRPLSADEVARLPGAGAAAAVTTTAPADAERAPATSRATASTATPTSRPSPGSTTSTTVASASATPGSRPSPGSTPTSAGAAATAPTTSSSSSSSSSTTTTTSAPPTTTTTAAPAATTTTAAPAPQAYSLVGGRVVVVAQAGQVSLVSASPNPGFSMEVAASGPDEVRVRFDGEDHRSELRARWEGGRLDVDVDEG